MEKKQHPEANKYSTPEKKKPCKKKSVAKKNQPFFQNKINKKKNYALKKKQEKTGLRKPPKNKTCV